MSELLIEATPAMQLHTVTIRREWVAHVLVPEDEDPLDYAHDIVDEGDPAETADATPYNGRGNWTSQELVYGPVEDVTLEEAERIHREVSDA